MKSLTDHGCRWARRCLGSVPVRPDGTSEGKGAARPRRIQLVDGRYPGLPVSEFGIATDPTAQVLNQELPSLVREGYTSYKLYMTYQGLQLTDRQVLDLLTAMRREQAITMVHAENGEFIEWLTERLVEKGLTAPKYHATSHSVVGEREGTHRAISMSELVGVPIVLVHVSAREVVEQIDWARAKGLAIHAETCPQYLLLTEDDYGNEGFEGAKLICTPPPRTVDDQEAIWAALARDAFDIVSSDHSPFRFADPKGKQIAGPNAGFHKVPNGILGVENRMPLLLSEGVLKNRIDLNQFVRLTSTNVAKLYGLHRCIDGSRCTRRTGKTAFVRKRAGEVIGRRVMKCCRCWNPS